jgi:hypothetical protein
MNIKELMLNHIDIPNRKIEYVIHSKVLVDGLWDCLSHYGVVHNKANHELLVELVQTKLVGNEDIEREWSEEEYINFVQFKG